MNDEQRRLWVLNDEGLYLAWKASNRPIKIWIRENRKLIDEVSGNVVSGEKPSHYLVYGA